MHLRTYRSLRTSGSSNRVELPIKSTSSRKASFKSQSRLRDPTQTSKNWSKKSLKTHWQARTMRHSTRERWGRCRTRYFHSLAKETCLGKKTSPLKTSWTLSGYTLQAVNVCRKRLACSALTETTLWNWEIISPHGSSYKPRLNRSWRRLIEMRSFSRP